MSDSSTGRWRATDLTGELVFDRYLGAGGDLVKLQELLSAAAPRWCKRLRIFEADSNQTPIDLSERDALARSVMHAAGERGTTYKLLVDTYGKGQFDRYFGSAELRGTGPELVVVVSVDELVASPLGAKLHLGNSIALQLRRPIVEDEAGATWLRRTMTDWCDQLAPAWASARHAAEYEEKVMSRSGRVYAEGRDFGRHLPGLFWLNFFGRPYVKLLGRDRLASAPAREITAVDDGMLLLLGSDPLEWQTPEYAAIEKGVRDHLGGDLFFSRDQPQRPGIVPSWGT